MITLEDMRNGLGEAIHYFHEETWYVPCFITERRTLEFDMSLSTTDEQMAWSFKPFYVYELKGVMNCIVPPDLSFYNNHGNGD